MSKRVVMVPGATGTLGSLLAKELSTKSFTTSEVAKIVSNVCEIPKVKV